MRLHLSLLNGELGGDGAERTYEGKISETVMALISLQSLVVDNATIPQMKAIHVLFQLIYGSPINSKGLQSDRPI